MPRPLRLEYKGAYYHVMNRGGGHQTIFHDAEYFLAFINTMIEAHQRFGAIFHAYCLMGNHYHLLIETPEANLGRIMRHINGVYTQRYNRLKKTDGPLFRGRYKAILVDSDEYLLPLSRYIHRNPIDTQKPLVKHLEDYKWSSYPVYTNREAAPYWLAMDQVHGALGKKQKYRAYKNYVELGVDDALLLFFGKGNQAAVLGGNRFREQALIKNTTEIDLCKKKQVRVKPHFNQVIAVTAGIFHVTDDDILLVQKGRQKRNLPRKVAMYLCQQVSGMSLDAIASAFGIHHRGGVSNALTEVRQLLLESESLKKKIRFALKLMK